MFFFIKRNKFFLFIYIKNKIVNKTKFQDSNKKIKINLYMFLKIKKNYNII